MKISLLQRFSLVALLFMLGLTGCSRTIDDVANWKAKGNIEKLIKALADPKIEVRIAAIQALGDLQAEPAVNHLAALFNDSDETIIQNAVEALSAIGSESTTTPLIAALKLELPTARTTAAIALGQFTASGAIQPLAEALDDSEASVQLAAAYSLEQIGDEKASAALVGKLGSSSVELRTACAQALGATGGDVATEGLIEALADTNAEVAKVAVASLIQLGNLSTPFALEALKNDTMKIREGSIAVLRGLKAVPLVGNNLIWYQLARLSVDDKETIDLDVVRTFVKMGDDAVDPLLEAAAHNVPDFREHAGLALERIGTSCLPKVQKAVDAKAGNEAKSWYEGRSAWKGSPSWRLDLWAAIAALNPHFDLDQAKVASLQGQGRPAFNVLIAPDFKPTRAYIPLVIDLLGDRTTPPPPQPDYDAEGIPIVKIEVDRFRGEANQQMALGKLTATPFIPTLPLIAAIEDPDELVAGHAAQILGEQGEKRALKPLMNVVATKLEAGEQLSTSAFYTALQKMDEPAAEPLLLKIRPNSDRAMRVFERHYPGVRPMSAETKDETGHHTQPVTFRLGYINDNNVEELMVTFAKYGNGDWKPSPPLPAELP